MQPLRVSRHAHTVFFLRVKGCRVGVLIHPSAPHLHPISFLVHRGFALNNHVVALGRLRAPSTVFPRPRNTHVRAVHLHLHILRFGREHDQRGLRLIAYRVNGRRRRGHLHPEVRSIELRLGVQRGIHTRTFAILVPRKAANRVALVVFGEQLVGHIVPTVARGILPLTRQLVVFGLRMLVLHGCSQIERRVDARVDIRVSSARATVFHHGFLRRPRVPDIDRNAVCIGHHERHTVRLAFVVVVGIGELAGHAQRIGLTLKQMLVLQRAAQFVDQFNTIAGDGIGSTAFYPRPELGRARLVAHQLRQGVHYLEVDVVGARAQYLVFCAVVVKSVVLSQRDGRHLRFRLRDIHHDLRGTSVERPHQVVMLVILYLDAVVPNGFVSGLEIEMELVRHVGVGYVDVFIATARVLPVLQGRRIVVVRGAEIEINVMGFVFGKGGNPPVFGLVGNLESDARIGPLRVQHDGIGFSVSETVQIVGTFAYPLRFRVVSIFFGRPAQERAGIVFVVRVDADSRGQRAYRLALRNGLARVFRIQGAGITGGFVQVELHGNRGGLAVGVQRYVPAVDALARVVGIGGFELPGWLVI